MKYNKEEYNILNERKTNNKIYIFNMYLKKYSLIIVIFHYL